MKRVLTLVLIVLCCTISNGQDKRFTAYAFSHPGHKDGFNIGVGVDYQMTIMYFKAQYFVFPELNGITYNEVVGVVGFNHHLGMFDTFRIFGGFKAGLLYRNGPYPVVGGEVGFDWYIPNTNIFIGVNSHLTYREDGKQWEVNAEEYWRGSNFIRLGITF